MQQEGGGGGRASQGAASGRVGEEAGSARRRCAPEQRGRGAAARALQHEPRTRWEQRPRGTAAAAGRPRGPLSGGSVACWQGASAGCHTGLSGRPRGQSPDACGWPGQREGCARTASRRGGRALRRGGAGSRDAAASERRRGGEHRRRCTKRCTSAAAARLQLLQQHCPAVRCRCMRRRHWCCPRLPPSKRRDVLKAPRTDVGVGVQVLPQPRLALLQRALDLDGVVLRAGAAAARGSGG